METIELNFCFGESDGKTCDAVTRFCMALARETMEKTVEDHRKPVAAKSS